MARQKNPEAQCSPCRDRCSTEENRKESSCQAEQSVNQSPTGIFRKRRHCMWVLRIFLVPFTRYRLNLCKQKQIFAIAKLTTSECVSLWQTQTINSDPVLWKRNAIIGRQKAGGVVRKDFPGNVYTDVLWSCVARPHVHILGLGSLWRKHLWIQIFQFCPRSTHSVLASLLFLTSFHS